MFLLVAIPRLGREGGHYDMGLSPEWIGRRDNGEQQSK